MSEPIARPSLDGRPAAGRDPRAELERSASHLLVDAGFDASLARRWLADSMALASHPPDACAAFAAATPFLVRVYRELESIERARRSRLLVAALRQVTRRAVASPGAAVLDLVAPVGADEARELSREFRREGERIVSDRLFDAAHGSAPRTPWADRIARGTFLPPASAAAGLAELAHAVLPSFAALVERAAVAVAFPGAADEGVWLARARDAAGDEPQPLRARDDVARVQVAADFANGEDRTALAILESGALTGDRSASAVALRACLRHRLGLPGVPSSALAGRIDPLERRRIARFLAQARDVPMGASEFRS